VRRLAALVNHRAFRAAECEEMLQHLPSLTPQAMEKSRQHGELIEVDCDAQN